MLKKGNKEPKQKSRVKTKLKQKVSKKKSHNDSEDLAKLTEGYHAFCTRLQGLVNALMNQHMAMQQLAKAKLQVAQQLAVMSKETVLYEAAGQTAGADRSTESVNSYFSIQEAVTSKNSMYAEKYKQFVVDYAQEWYKTVTDRVGQGLKKAETMRVELDHYQSKVESLRQSANSTMAKGKQVDPKAAEKLTRNEDKLIKTRESTSKFINDLCLLMEEVTERSWRDLHPLMVKCSQFETQVSGDESKAQASLSEVVAALKKIADDHGIKSEARLKDLGQLDPSQLSTRSKDDNRNLAIENGFAGMGLGGSSGSTGGSVYSSDNNSSYFPPGSTAAQGLGGFPVKVQPSNDFSGHNRTSFASSNGAPSAMNMMNINAAPAPTLDTMAQAFGGSTSATASYGRMGSYDSFHSRTSANSNFGGTPAPPPSAAPPPPPPSTPGFGPPVTGPYGAAPAPSPMMGGYPQQSPMPARGYAQQQSPYAPQQSPYAPQQSPMPTRGYAQQQTPGGYAPQQTPGGFSPQQSPMGGNFAQQQQPQQQSMYTSPPPPAHGHNPFG
eukprot:CAMPEP_0116081420 /NCGR_PEP_ID=MMETSP0327-20121206/2187_1 /TAXON_ID=44447 /ORGANISM="Pseudo-nitzschia delicatissima, Strain B596" /LENGTH=551 /DNA_ID=CAMNT_0003572153 /DNA_START=156 /DNA_END=1811 /DNA_ORIENTATION=-